MPDVTMPVHIPSPEDRRTINIMNMVVGQLSITVKFRGEDRTWTLDVHDIMTYDNVFRSGGYHSISQIDNGYTETFHFLGEMYNVHIVSSADTGGCSPRCVYMVEHQEQYGKWIVDEAFYNMNLAMRCKNELVAMFFLASASNEEFESIFGEGYSVPEQKPLFMNDALQHTAELDDFQMKYMDFGVYRIKCVPVSSGEKQ